MLRGSLRDKETQGPIFGGSLHIPSPEIVEWFGLLGFDFALIDSEQGQMSVQTCTEMVRAANVVGMHSIIRIPYHDPRLIDRSLNSGATGVMVPHLTTVAQAEELVAHAKYAPIGHRSFAGHARASGYAQVHKADDYQAMANRETMIFAIIEDEEGLENLDDILKVDGLDVFSVGMRDLSTSLGYQGDWNHPNVQKIVEEVVEKVMAAGRQYWQSGSSDAELAVRARRYAQGVRYFTVGALDLISRSAGEVLKFREEVS